PRDRDRPVAGPQRAVANGCPDQELLCHGRGDAAGAAGGSEHDSGSAKLRIRLEAASRQLSPDAVELRLAPYHRRRAEGGLRPPTALQIPEVATARGRRRCFRSSDL